MASGEYVAVVFDRDDLAETGLEITPALQVVEAFRQLADHALQYRMSATTTEDSPPRTYQQFALTLRATPIEGSIKLPLWAFVIINSLGVVADMSQTTGVSLRDAFAAINARQSEHTADDEITKGFTRSGETANRVTALFKAAAASGCTYVAVEWDNQETVIYGARSAKLSLLTSGSIDKIDHSDIPPFVRVGDLAVFEVYYHGRSYRAFVTDSKGTPISSYSRTEETVPVYVMLWGSEVELHGDRSYSIQAEQIDPFAVTHDINIPEPAIQARKIFIVTGASELQYR